MFARKREGHTPSHVVPLLSTRTTSAVGPARSLDNRRVTDRLVLADRNRRLDGSLLHRVSVERDEHGGADRGHSHALLDLSEQFASGCDQSRLAERQQLSRHFLRRCRFPERHMSQLDSHVQGLGGVLPAAYVARQDRVVRTATRHVTLMFLAYAVACASLAIVGSALSVVLLWLAGGYLYVRRRRLAPCFVLIIALLTLLICKSVVRLFGHRRALGNVVL
jgi:hypothetical protein